MANLSFMRQSLTRPEADVQNLVNKDHLVQEWAVLTEKPDWVFGAELISCGSELYTIGGVSSRQVDR